jgi:hypothetical protein
VNEEATQGQQGQNALALAAAENDLFPG